MEISAELPDVVVATASAMDPANVPPSSVKEFAKIMGIFLAVVAAFKAIEYFTELSCSENEKDDFFFEDRDVSPMDSSDPSIEKIEKVTEKSPISSSGVWEGEGEEGFYLDERGNDWYFNNRQPG